MNPNMSKDLDEGGHPPAEAGGRGCLCCPKLLDELNLTQPLHPGFGDVEVIRDEQGMALPVASVALHGFHVEEMAEHDPDHDWRIEIFGPLRGATYQRQGDKRWVLIATNEGFA